MASTTTNSHIALGYHSSMYASAEMEPSFLNSEDTSLYKKSSPMSSTSSTGNPATWSPNTNADSDASELSSGSPPASDDGFPTTNYPGGTSADWDLLSEMLIDDAMVMTTATHHQPHAHSGFVGGTMGYSGIYGAPPTRPLAHPHSYIQQHQQQQQPPVQHFQQHQQFQHRRTPVVVPTSGFMDALLLQDDAPMELAPNLTISKSSAVGSPQTTDLFPPVPILGRPHPPPDSSASSSESDTSPTPSPHPRARKIANASSSFSTALRKDTTAASGIQSSHKLESLTPEEAKKLRRRSQIASSVQRHREKKKCLVAALKEDLSSLTAQLTTLRSQRKVLHSNNDRLVAWEEEAITQRRKRKQSEELNQRMKKALFQQTCFLMGMRGIFTNVPAPREMHIHDWLHAYTVLTAREKSTRQKEYASCFSDSKVEMASQIVLRETDPFAARLTLSNPYFSEIRVLHDGSECMWSEEDVVVKRELKEATEFVVPGSGQVAKKYTSMFLFEERGNCTIETFKHVALAATKAVGVFWPSPGYQSHALDTMTLEDGSEIIFSDLHGSMSIVDDQITPEDEDVQLEARMLCRVKHTENETVIAWDYADKDELYPIQGERSIRRDSCGAAVVRREPGGKISFRSVCVKMFGPMDSHETVSDEVKALTQRRISLQASEIERANQKCTRSVYESLAAAFTAMTAKPQP